ncbi:MAG: riboflavin synthase [Nitrospinae bacterium]|nr:riboflavin synthase [Nitrospinota bacterium]
MFTGIVAGTGRITSIIRRAEDFSLEVDAGGFVPEPVIGESVAVDGVCLTVTSARGQTLSFDVSVETLSRTSLGAAKPGNAVNLERAMRMGDRLGGHLVSGHVDAVGALVSASPSGQGYEVEVELPAEGMKYVIEKGSIAISGISLTVAQKKERSVTVAVIPHTWSATILPGLRPGGRVNIEYDMIGKYVENFMSAFHGAGKSGPSGGEISEEFLARHGFLK